MTTAITLEALCHASAVSLLDDLERETRWDVTLTENGKPWARVQVAPLTDSKRSAFPLTLDGHTGDTRKRGQAGAVVGPDSRHALSVVVDRAARMAR